MAIAGIGTDIVEIARINRDSGQRDRLAKRVLTDTELACYATHNQPERYLAKRFAAKEAAVKALGTGIGRGIYRRSGLPRRRSRPGGRAAQPAFSLGPGDGPVFHPDLRCA